MRILVHLCCGPCGIMPLRRLLDAGHELTGLFFNPNIHPLSEYMRRREGAVQTAEVLGLPLILADSLDEAEQAWAVSRQAVPGGPEEGPEEQPEKRDQTQSRSLALPLAADPRPWLRAADREKDRCAFCWRIRLEKTAQLAAGRGFEAFSSSLLYSRYQNHERIRELGEGIAQASGVGFVYEDFRTSWQEGIRLSREWGIYRQQYCGCVFSEYERYSRDFAALRGRG